MRKNVFFKHQIHEEYSNGRNLQTENTLILKQNDQDQDNNFENSHQKYLLTKQYCYSKSYQSGRDVLVELSCTDQRLERSVESESLLGLHLEPLQGSIVLGFHQKLQENITKISENQETVLDFAKIIYCYFHGAIVKGYLQKGLFSAIIARFLFHSMQPPIAYYSSIQHCSQITEIF